MAEPIQKYATVVTLGAVQVATNTVIDFGDGIKFTKIPAWLTADTQWLSKFSAQDRQEILATRHVFITEYECKSLGEPDSRWKTGTKSKQNVKTDIISLANLAIWLSKRTPACMGFVFHCR